MSTAKHDESALRTLLDILRYVERELHFLQAPVPEASALVGQAAVSIEGALGPKVSHAS